MSEVTLWLNPGFLPSHNTLLCSQSASWRWTLGVFSDHWCPIHALQYYFELWMLVIELGECLLLATHGPVLRPQALFLFSPLSFWYWTTATCCWQICLCEPFNLCNRSRMQLHNCMNVFNVPKFSNTTPLLCSPHWLLLAAAPDLKCWCLPTVQCHKTDQHPPTLKHLHTSTAQLVSPSLWVQERHASRLFLGCGA